MKHISLYTLLSAALFMAACSSDPIEDAASTSDLNGQEGDYVTLQIRQAGSGTQKKASAYKRDLGHEYDYKLHDLCLFVYETSEASPINSLGVTPLKYKKYLTEADFTEFKDRPTDGHDGHYIDAYDVTASFTMPHYKRTLLQQVIVVANVGNITEDCHFLADVRNYLPAQGCTYSEGAYSNFAMGMYEEAEWVNPVSHEATVDDPYKINVTLERISARVDHVLTQFPSAEAQAADKYAPIPYDVVVSGSTLARNWITHARLVNAMQKPSYIIRRTADNPRIDATSANVVYLGTDSEDGAVAATTVLTPYTADMRRLFAHRTLWSFCA